MNNLEKIFTGDIEKYSKSYFDYLKQIFDQIDLSEIKNFVEAILSARDLSLIHI